MSYWVTFYKTKRYEKTTPDKLYYLNLFLIYNELKKFNLSHRYYGENCLDFIVDLPPEELIEEIKSNVIYYNNEHGALIKTLFEEIGGECANYLIHSMFEDVPYDGSSTGDFIREFTKEDLVLLRDDAIETLNQLEDNDGDVCDIDESILNNYYNFFEDDALFPIKTSLRWYIYITSEILENTNFDTEMIISVYLGPYM